MALESGSLCATCALCCDGTLFETVPMAGADSLPVLRQAGIEIRQRGDGIDFEQPCPALADRRCTVYDARPSACRRFRCKTLNAYEAGALTWTDAVARVTRALTVRAAVHAELKRRGSTPAAPLESCLPDETALAANRALRQDWAPVLLAMAALRDCLETYFVARSQKGEPGKQPVG
jgi:Fe-S-cluster containining protein